MLIKIKIELKLELKLIYLFSLQYRKMVVIKIANYSVRCPFTKTIIRPKNIICLFNQEQFNAFEKNIYKVLNRLPDEIISIIIEKTGYQKLIGRFGHESVTHWTKSTIRKERNYESSDNESSDNESSNHESSNDESSDNESSDNESSDESD